MVGLATTWDGTVGHQRKYEVWSSSKCGNAIFLGPLDVDWNIDIQEILYDMLSCFWLWQMMLYNFPWVFENLREPCLQVAPLSRFQTAAQEGSGQSCCFAQFVVSPFQSGVKLRGMSVLAELSASFVPSSEIWRSCKDRQVVLDNVNPNPGLLWFKWYLNGTPQWTSLGLY